MTSRLESDPRVDLRIRKSFAGMAGAPGVDVTSREALLAQEHPPDVTSPDGMAICMRLNEPTLREVAPMTGGEYHHAVTAENLRSV